MKQLFFDKNELQIVESLLEAATTIDNIYENLYNLEITGKKDSEDYRKLLNALKKAKKIEEARIKQANIDYDQAIKIILLLQNTPTWIKNNNLYCTLLQKYDDRVIRRIINIFNYQIKISIKYQEKHKSKEIIEFLHILGETEEDLLKDMSNYEKVNFAINDDIESTLIAILSDYISNPAYSIYKNQLIKAKYYIAFINRNIESQLLAKGFDSTEETYINSTLIANMLGKTQEEYHSIIAINTLYYLMPQISELLSITDDDYSVPEKNVESILRQCYIRAMLTMLSDEDVQKVNNKFLSIINSKQYIQKHTTDSISENAVACCFKCQNFDKGKMIRTLSINTTTGQGQE